MNQSQGTLQFKTEQDELLDLKIKSIQLNEDIFKKKLDLEVNSI